MSYPTPLYVDRDFPAMQDVLGTVCAGLQLPYEVVVAQTMQESRWTLRAYRYEPNYDKRYIGSRWHTDPAWIIAGMTIDEWFRANRQRAKERVPGRDYSSVAQLRIASSYGFSQIMYPTAVQFGYKGLPETLFGSASIEYGAKILSHYYKKLRQQWPEKTAIMIALAQYNGGAIGNTNPAQLRNIEYVRAVNRCYTLCWGESLFGSI